MLEIDPATCPNGQLHGTFETARYRYAPIANKLVLNRAPSLQTWILQGSRIRPAIFDNKVKINEKAKHRSHNLRSTKKRLLWLYGKKVKTPHLDQLRSEGKYFSNCITPSPVCQPARAAILTGMLPKTNGVKDNGIDLRAERGELGFAGMLSKAGYNTALIGKAHFATTQTFSPQETPECKIGSANYSPDWYGPYMGFDHVELLTQGHWYKIRPPVKPPSGQHFENWFFNIVGKENGFDLWQSETRAGIGASQTWASALPVAWHSSTWVGDRSIDWLSNRPENEPLSLGLISGSPSSF